MSPPVIVLSNGVKMPQVGLGTWQSASNDVKAATKEAIKTGYRLIDTAERYENEEYIGAAIMECIAEGIIKREDLFITTKYYPYHDDITSMEDVLRESLRKLGTDYVDLYLIHSPCCTKGTDFKPQDVTVEDLWKGFEKLYSTKLTRSIGVSNFSIEQIERIMKIATVPIHNHQVELSIYWPQHDLHEVCKKYNISITSYGTLGSPGRLQFALPNGMKVFEDNVPHQLEDSNVVQLAKKYSKTPAQVLIRYVMDRGIAVIPKSVNAKRIKENFDLFDFQLTQEEVALLESSGIKIRTFLVPFWVGHPEDPYVKERQ